MNPPASPRAGRRRLLAVLMVVAAGWLRTPPLAGQALRGRLLRALSTTYAAAGLVVVGVHTPEFGFEKPTAYVERAARELGVTWPIAVDPEHRIWNAFGNSHWPAQYLLDRQGRVRLAHTGEGDDDVLEAAVRRLLDEGGAAGAAHLGAERGADTLGTGVVQPGQTVRRDDPDPGPSGVALRGSFTGAADALAAAPGARVVLRFAARDVYAVLAPAGPGPVAVPAQVEVRLDGLPVPPGRRGPSLRVLPDGTTVADVGDENLRHLVTDGEGGGGDGTLELLARDAAARLFTFSFGA